MDFLFNAGISEKNLFGRGQSLNGTFAIGSKQQDFIVSYNEPYFNDSKVALGLTAFNTETGLSRL